MEGLVSIQHLVSGRMDALAGAYRSARRATAVYALYAHLCEDLAMARVLHAHGYITRPGFDALQAHADQFLAANDLNRRKSCRPDSA